MNKPSERVWAWLEGELPAWQATELEAWLREDPANMRFFVRESHLHRQLRELLLGQQGGKSGASGPALPPVPNPVKPAVPDSPDTGGWHFVIGYARWLVAMAAVLLIVGSLAWVGLRHYRSGRMTPEALGSGGALFGGSQTGVSAADSRPLARLVRTRDCRWTGPSPFPEIGAALSAGQPLELASGLVEIDFDIGATVILQGPASLRLLATNTARLDKGKAAVEIKTAAARGFKLLTPDTQLVDQGTEFGVDVSPAGGTKVHVFQGLVDVQRTGNAGGADFSPCRLQANYGARADAGGSSVVLVEDTGENYVRSMDQADRDQHVVAYWRFEDRPVGVLLPDTKANSQPICATVDSSFNGNDLYAANSKCQPMFSPDVPVTTVTHSGCPNRSCLDTTQPTVDIRRVRNVYTHSQFSHASPLDIQQITPQRWTIEASVKAAKLSGTAQGFLGRDANFTYEAKRAPARLIFQINAAGRFSIGFHDADGRFHEAVAENLPVEAGRWYHLAASSDGRVLRLYVDALDGRGYVERAATPLPATGLTALGKGQDIAEWTIGRAGNAGDPADWLRFWGWIDEVRISDVARSPADFLFASEGHARDKSGQFKKE